MRETNNKTEKAAPNPGPFPPKRLTPSLFGAWYLFVGALMGPVVLALGRHTPGRAWAWILLSAAMICLIVHRLSVSYSLSQEKIQASSWWGLGREETITTSELCRVEPRYSFSSRLVGQGHLYLGSQAPEESGLTLLSQKKPEELAERLMALAQAARERAGLGQSQPEKRTERVDDRGGPEQPDSD
ncbi:MAG: hypothetical protein LBR11_06145 [Deltaproteobacteria bacterium]|nr:hypothetical protein [Deltaproteobacteria bacterium]